MGWEIRGRSRRLYYVRKVWEGGKCRNVYVGPGEVGLQAEREDRAAREAKRAERRSRRRKSTAPAPPSAAPLDVVAAPAQASPEPPQMPSERAKTPLWRPGLLSYPAAVAQIQAVSGSDVDVAAFIDGLDMDDVTRALLRRKFLRVL